MAVTLPVSAKDRIRFTPPRAEGEAAPTYLIAPSTNIERARWRRDVARQGARLVDVTELRDHLRKAVETLLSGELKDKALADLETVNQALESVSSGEKVPENFAEAFKATAELEAICIRDWPPYAEAYADREYHFEVSRILAARYFLRGWEGVLEECSGCDGTGAKDDVPCARCEGAGNVPLKFKTKDGLISEECFAVIPRSDIYDVGLQAMALMTPNAGRRKN